MNATKRIKYACYATNVTMSVVSNISPLLFMTFKSTYGISFSLLGLLTFICFATQLVVDLAFSFFSHKLNIKFAVKATPIIAAIGLLIYALSPFLFVGNVYLGLVIGTFVFSAAAGFAEVLISPVIAALPADDPDREVSKLHSIYAWGVVFVIIFSTLYLHIFSFDGWPYLVLIFTVIPIVASLLFSTAAIPDLDTPQSGEGVKPYVTSRKFWLCVLAIFFGGATECTMSQWASGYLEAALGIPKVMGDIFGMAIFMVMLGLGRSLYAKYGHNISKILFIGASGAVICYLSAALSPHPLIGLFACAFTGLCVSMLWPGSLIAASAKFPTAGVFLYAMMAAGGDFGAAIGPQIVGIVTDLSANSTWIAGISDAFNISVEQISLRVGIISGTIFAITATLIYLILMKTSAHKAQKSAD